MFSYNVICPLSVNVAKVLKLSQMFILHSEIKVLQLNIQLPFNSFITVQLARGETYP